MAWRTVSRQASPGVRAERVRIAVQPALWCAGVAVLGAAADAASKAWAISRLSGGRDITMAGGLAVRATGRAERLGAALAAAGAAGNLIDRLTRAPAPLHGGVVDWLHVSFYGPTFNLADVWLRAGALIAVAGWLWQHRRRPS